MRMLQLLSLLCAVHAQTTAQALRDIIPRFMTSVSPREGSVVGNTVIVIKGGGFSTDYSAGHNIIMIDRSECVTKERAGFGACTVLCSNQDQIVCTTAARAASGSGLAITVTVDGQFQIPPAADVTFKYVAGRSGNLMGVFPSSGKAGTVLNLRGYGWSTMRDDANSLVIGNALDTFKYVLVGSESARVSSADGAAPCVGYNDANSDMHYNYYKPRYLSDSSAFNDLVALKNLYQVGPPLPRAPDRRHGTRAAPNLEDTPSRQRYILTPEINATHAHTHTHTHMHTHAPLQPDHYRCKLPVFSPGSYKTRVSMTFGDAEKSPTSKQTDLQGVEYEFQVRGR
jgi:hypothetical protein